MKLQCVYCVHMCTHASNAISVGVYRTGFAGLFDTPAINVIGRNTKASENHSQSSNTCAHSTSGKNCHKERKKSLTVVFCFVFCDRWSVSSNDIDVLYHLCSFVFSCKIFCFEIIENTKEKTKKLLGVFV